MFGKLFILVMAAALIGAICRVVGREIDDLILQKVLKLIDVLCYILVILTPCVISLNIFIYLYYHQSKILCAIMGFVTVSQCVAVAKEFYKKLVIVLST